eukprot:3523310-Pleurochrysis_carterae.AAC.2
MRPKRSVVAGGGLSSAEPSACVVLPVFCSLYSPSALRNPYSSAPRAPAAARPPRVPLLAALPLSGEVSLSFDASQPLALRVSSVVFASDGSASAAEAVHHSVSASQRLAVVAAAPCTLIAVWTHRPVGWLYDSPTDCAFRARLRRISAFATHGATHAAKAVRAAASASGAAVVGAATVDGGDGSYEAAMKLAVQQARHV